MDYHEMLESERLRVRSMTRRHYSRPPVIEALIDLQVETPPNSSLEQLQPLQESLALEFPEAKEHIRGEVEVSLSANAAADMKQIRSVDGYLLVNAPRTHALQLRLPAFTFSHLQPYTSWEVLRDMARKYWQLYVAAMRPMRVTRIAVRYVNRFDIPAARIEFKDYFLTGPELAPGLPQAFSRYFFQIQIPAEVMGADVLLNQTIVPPTAPDTTSVLFDIDVFSNEPMAPAADSLWTRLDALHEIADSIFEASITDLTREVIA